MQKKPRQIEECSFSSETFDEFCSESKMTVIFKKTIRSCIVLNLLIQYRFCRMREMRSPVFMMRGELLT